MTATGRASHSQEANLVPASQLASKSRILNGCAWLVRLTSCLTLPACSTSALSSHSRWVGKSAQVAMYSIDHQQQQQHTQMAMLLQLKEGSV
jgi:hypothetical protein